MFKNMIVYRIAAPWQLGLDQVEAALAKTPFLPCAATQERSWGWVPPRGEAHGPLAESVHGQWVLCWMVESKVLPGAVLARRVQEKVLQFETEMGRKPGRKRSQEFKDEAKLDLLPMAFTKQSRIGVWIDTQAGFVVVDTSSQARADEVSSALVQALAGLSLSLLDTQISPSTAMAHWLRDQAAPAGLTIDRECELKSLDESKAVVRYARHPLDIDEVRGHIEAGKLPTKLALTWADRVSFVLTDSCQVKKLAFLDAALEDSTPDDGGFDADVALWTGELAQLLPDLIEALGGEGGRTAAEPAPF